MPAPKVLVVATSHDQMGSTGHRTGVWLEELATPYYALLDGGAEVTLVSIKGGAIPWDPRSLPAEAGEGPGEKPEEQQEVPASVHRFLSDESVMQTARNSPALGSVDPGSFDAVFLPGGHGPMWDAANDETLARIVGSMFDQGKVVAAVCHGPAGLVKATREDGRPIVDGRRVSGFTNTEEEAVGLTKVVPFLLEDRLKELGGRFERGPAEGEENWLLRHIAAKSRENPFVWQMFRQERVLPLGASADGLPRDEPDFEALKAGKTVEIGGIRGCFRQTSAKSFCRLDDIFEPTLGDVIQASGSEVLRFVPDEAASLVSSPILFVQDQRHLIES